MSREMTFCLKGSSESDTISFRNPVFQSIKFSWFSTTFCFRSKLNVKHTMC